MRLGDERLGDDWVDVNSVSKEFDALDLNLDPPTGSGQPEGESATGKQSRLISKVLSPALKLWVRSQLDHVEDLHLDIEAGDRQLLSGAVQRVSASARKGIYQGLHLSQISLIGQQIQTNLGQVVRGKPFRLLAAFPITGTVALSEADLNASLTAPLLANAVTEFLLSFLLNGQQAQAGGQLTQPAATFQNLHMQLGEGQLTFKAVLHQMSGQTYPITIRTGMQIQDGNCLVLEDFQCQVSGAEASVLPAALPDRWVFNLGNEVFLEELRIQPQRICCRGRIVVQP